MDKPQVDKEHYQFATYLDVRRLSSVWFQLLELELSGGNTFLEIGPGNGLMRTIGALYDLEITTFDFDESLKPDHVGSASDMQFPGSSFDVVCAFQMLEHLPFDESLLVLKEMARVAKRSVIISLPDSRRLWTLSGSVPIFGAVQFSLSNPFFTPRPHIFGGEHYWELNKEGYALKSVIARIHESCSLLTLTKSYRNPHNPYHHFFVFDNGSA